MDHLYASGSKLLEIGKRSDFTIKCGAKVYKAHRTILGIHSKYFDNLFDQDGFEENKTNEIELNDDNPRAINMMIQFFYTYTYQCVAVTASGTSAASSELELNDYSEVSVVADKYDVPDLQTLAAQKYLQVLERTYTTINPLPTLTRLLVSASTEDAPIHTRLLPFWLRHSSFLGEKYGGQKSLNALIRSSNYFTVHIAMAISGATLHHSCAENRQIHYSQGRAFEKTKEKCRCIEWPDGNKALEIEHIFARKT